MVAEVDVKEPLAAPHACREGCGACCIAPSISSPIPGMPHGKPAGVRCVQLDANARCMIFGRPERPACCSGLQPSAEMCGASRSDALVWLARLEAATQPSHRSPRAMHRPGVDAHARTPSDTGDPV